MAETKKTKTEKIDTVSENEALKKQLAEQEAKMQELMGKMEMMTQLLANQAQPAKKTVASQRKIEFVNMVGGTLVLRGSNVYEIGGRFNSATFPEQEAQVIIANTKNAVNNGLVYITDAQFVEENGLSGLYSTMLDNKTLMNLLNNSYDKVIDIYKNSSENQRSIIIEYIIEKQEKGEHVDANILVELGKLSGVNLMEYGVKKEE